MMSMPVAAQRHLESRSAHGDSRGGHVQKHSRDSTHDVTPDGQRFIMIKPDAARGSQTIHAVQNCTEELKRLVPQ
jgi:hypothetical protein